MDVVNPEQVRDNILHNAQCAERLAWHRRVSQKRPELVPLWRLNEFLRTSVPKVVLLEW